MTAQALPDKDARTRALDINASFIVQAPAGSGKTDLLVSRYLKLLAVVAEPEELLAITFTRKAAAQMRARILEALSGEASPERWAPLIRAALARDTERGWRLIHSPARLRVMTIDSLCQQLVRQMPWTAGFGALPGVTEKAGPLFNEAVRSTLKFADDTNSDYRDDLLRLLTYFDNNTAQVESLLEEMLQRRDQWAEALLGSDSVIDRATLEANLAQVVTHALQSVAGAFTPHQLAAVHQLANVARDNLLETDLPCPFDAFALSDGAPCATAAQLDVWHALGTLLLTKTGTVRKQVNKNVGFPPSKANEQKAAKKAMTECLADINADPARKACIERLAILPPSRFYGDDQWALLEALSRVLRLALAQLTLAFNRAGEVDFSEMQLRAIAALAVDNAPTDLALRLDYRISHILVDEFQDTSVTQCRLLELLTAGWSDGGNDGQTLFVVGDPMQSIYRFRQSEVALFMRYSAEPLGHVHLTPLKLTANFRSVKPVVDWVNDAFNVILPASGDTVTGAVPFSASVAMKTDQSASQSESVFVHACSTVDEEATRVADLIEAHHQAFPDHRIAVLVRARSHLDTIVPVLRERGIRYRGVALEPLATRPVVRDLFCLTRALVHPADHVAWTAILRAPWCGLSLDSLLALSELINDGDRSRRTPIVMLTPMVRLLEEGHLSQSFPESLSHLVRTLSDAVNARGRFKLSERVRRTWNALSGPACCSRRSDLVDAQTFFELLDDVDSGDDIKDFESLVSISANLRAAADSESTEQLQLMPIHQAKGLEFDCVIVPGLGRRSAADQQKLVLMGQVAAGDEGPRRLVAPPTPRQGEEDGIYSMIRRHESTCTKLEHARLLYVASTRAHARMHLLAVPSMSATKGVAPIPGSSLELMWPAVCQYFEDEPFEQADATDHAEQTSCEQPLRVARLPDDYQPPQPSPSLDFGDLRPDNDNTPDDSELIEFSWAGEVARHVGTVVHEELALIANEGIEHWSAQRLADRQSLWERTLILVGLNGADLEQAMTNIHRALTTTLTSETGRWILTHHPQARSELPLTGRVGDQIRSLVVDRTFVVEGVRWILDYKTSFHAGSNLNQFLKIERERYSEQLNGYAAVVNALDSKGNTGKNGGSGGLPIRLALYFPLYDHLLDWDYDR